MRTAFYIDVTAVVAGLLLMWTGLTHLPPTRWLFAGDRLIGWESRLLARRTRWRSMRLLFSRMRRLSRHSHASVHERKPNEPIGKSPVQSV